MAKQSKCPKCKSNNLTFEEHWFSTIEFRQENGIINMVGNLTDRKQPYKLTATCDKCNHEWTIRNATQITDVLEEYS